MRLQGFVVVVALAGLCAPASAQGIALTVDDAVTRALKESYRVAELRAREQGAQAAAAGRAAAGKPQLAVQAGYMRTNHVDEFGVPQPAAGLRIIYPDIPDNYRTRLDASWPLYTGGRVEALTRSARAEAMATSRDRSALEADVRLEITRVYWNAVTAAESARVTNEALDRTDAHLRDLRARLDAGLIPPNDVLSAEAQRSRQEVQVIEARNASELSIAELRRLAGLDPGVPVQLTTTLDNPPQPGDEPLEAQIARARAARPERAALVERIDAASARLAAADSTRRPSVSVLGGVDYARPNPRIFPRLEEWRESWDVSVNATWSLWDAGRRAAEVGEASAAQQALRARLQEFDSVLELELRQRRLDLQAGLAAVKAATDGVRSAAEARRVVGERFAAGVVTSTDVLEAQVALLQAELDRTRALATVRLADARLARALGR